MWKLRTHSCTLGYRRNQKGNSKISQEKNAAYQNLWDMAKAVLRRKFIGIKVCSKKETTISNI